MLLSVVKRNSSCQTNLKPFSSSSIFLTNCLRFFSKTLLYKSGNVPTRLNEAKKLKAMLEVYFETAAPVMLRSVKFKMPPIDAGNKLFLEVPGSKCKSNSCSFEILLMVIKSYFITPLKKHPFHDQVQCVFSELLLTWQNADVLWKNSWWCIAFPRNLIVMWL